MKARRTIMIAGVLLVAGIAVITGTRNTSPEPIYQGKTVTQWVKAFGTAPKPGFNASGTTFSSQAMAVVTTTDLRGNKQTVMVPLSAAANLTNLLNTSLSNFARGRTVSLTTNQMSLPITFSQSVMSQNDPAYLAVKSIGEDAVPYLIAALKRQDSMVDAVQRALWRHSPPTIQTNYLRAPFPAVQLRRNAAELLELLKATNALPALTQAVEDADSAVRLHACKALSGLRQSARSATPALVKALMDSNPPVGNEAFVALDRISATPEGMAGLARGWKQSRPQDFNFMRFSETNNLTGPMGATVLGQMLEEASTPFRREILTRLQLFHRAAAFAEPHVSALLKEPDQSVKIKILTMQILEGMGPAANAALPELERLKDDEDREIANTAWTALQGIKRKRD